MLPACSTAPPPLAGTFDSPSQVATAVLAAVAAGDEARLSALALSEQEFREHIWPALPAARPERNLPFSYVWGDLRQKSLVGLAAVLERHRNHRFTLVDVRFGDSTPYQGYVVHRESVFVVKSPTGETEEVRLCGSMVEQAGRWKVFSYVASD